MPKKKFEDSAPYDPIAADLAREVAAAGRAAAVPTTASTAPVVAPTARRFETQSEAPRRHEIRPATPPPNPKAEPTARPSEPTIAKRFVVTRSEDEDIAAMLHRLSQKAGTKVTLSVLARTCFVVAMHAEEQLAAELANNPPPALPSTHDAIASANFEDHVTDILVAAFRKMPRRAK